MTELQGHPWPPGTEKQVDVTAFTPIAKLINIISMEKMFGIYNITSGKEIVKSTLFCKVRYVLYSGIKRTALLVSCRSLLMSPCRSLRNNNGIMESLLD
jgi:hypothetical protein